jgi:hypothetical protein
MTVKVAEFRLNKNNFELIKILKYSGIEKIQPLKQ